MPLGENTRRVILEYIKHERARFLKNSKEQALFVSLHGRRLSETAYSQIVVPKQVHESLTLHGFRHACATHMLENGASSVHLQKLLGHEKLSTTQIYTRLSVKELKAFLKQFHPRG